MYQKLPHSPPPVQSHTRLEAATVICECGGTHGAPECFVAFTHSRQIIVCSVRIAVAGNCGKVSNLVNS